MSVLKQLQRKDVVFIGGENDRVYQHTAGLVILDNREPPGLDFETFKRHAIERLEKIPHMRWKLHQVPLGLDMPYWVEDEDFDYDHHFKRIAVPSPGDRKAVGELVGHLYARHLDRSRPLWEMWFIEGLEDGRLGILQITHHCMMDGRGAARLGEILCDFAPGAKPRPIDRDLAEACPGAVPTERAVSAGIMRRYLQLPWEASRNLYGLLRTPVLRRLRNRDPVPARKPRLVLTRLNGDVSADRALVFGTLPLSDIKRVTAAHGVTVNDVVLAVVSTSLRSYLQNLDELPRTALLAQIAVSLRSDDDKTLSNQVTTASVGLATEEEDPLARLEAIHRQAADAKQGAHHGGVGVMEMLGMLPPLALTVMGAGMSADQAAQMLGANVAISNLRGNSQPMYIAGARLEGMYPMSIIAPGLAINVTCISYCGGVNFGITLAPERFPEPWRLIDGLHAGLEEYLQPLRKRKPTRKTRGKGTTKRKAAKPRARVK